VMGSFVVPATATVGDKKMRVIMQRGAYPLACGNTPIGEVEDYLFTVTNTLQSTKKEVNSKPIEPLEGVLIYPNPAMQTVTLDFSVLNGAETQVRILDALGRVDYQEKTTQPSVQLDVTDWESGVYLVYVEVTGQRPTVHKLVVVKE
jgi:Secretion system C-terminal sorting domain/GEVED domain